ncbi:MAG TPA: response regulator [bacterium]|nr:response regulator [bacterium]
MARKTILTVDDDRVILEAIHEVFSSDYNILMAHDGHEAVELANEHHVDLILLDIMMPGFDGFSTLMLLKDSPNTKDIPVIMLTAVGKKEKVISAFKDGAAGYLLKPFKADTLRNKIESVLSTSEKEEAEKADTASENDN